MSQKIISGKNLSVGLPLQTTALVYLFLDNVNATGWVWGVAGTFIAFWWIIGIAQLFTAEYIDVFEDTNLVIKKK